MKHWIVCRRREGVGQHERQRKTMFPCINEYTSLFGLNKARLAQTKPDALIMHPGPINRGVEIDSDIADSVRSLILEQVTTGWPFAWRRCFW